MSLAEPFAIRLSDTFEEVNECDLPPILMEYFKDVLCSGNDQHWVWLRSYLANLILKPDEKTAVMLVLYSQENRCGKSSLLDLLICIMKSSNIGKIEDLKDAFGERGAYAHIGKKLLWLEELAGAGSTQTFGDCMNRMKTAITDPEMSTRAMYQGAKRSRNYLEFIACTNNLVGVLRDRTTVLNVSNIHRGDHVWFGELRSFFTTEVLTKFVMYLSKYVVANPMKIVMSEAFNTMSSNCEEPIKEFVDDLKYNVNLTAHHHTISRHHPTPSDYFILTDVYSEYTSWCNENGVKRISQTKMKAKILHYCGGLKVEQIDRDGRRGLRVLTIPVDFLCVNNRLDSLPI
jgi:hypothetical protein